MMKQSALSLCVLLSLMVYAQDARPDRWKGFVIDETTPEAVLEVLGKPTSDKLDRLRVFDVETKWVTKRIERKIFRKLEFKPEKLDKAILSFLDGKLVMIEIDLQEKIDASALSRIYGVDFLPRISGLDLAVNPKDYERREGRVYPIIYPNVFSIVAVTEKVFVGALVSKIGVAALVKDVSGIPDADAIPGRVERIQIISRRLENKDGGEALR